MGVLEKLVQLTIATSPIKEILYIVFSYINS